ncbi:MAG: GGDEF domain-containing response regulator [Hyphomicrobiaceae bacterium]
MHIVVVDPSRVALKLVAELLVPNGHAVDLFTDALSALSFVEQNPSVEVVVTSLEMEPITGIELCWRARLLASPRRPLYIIVMSSSGSDRSLAEALDSGADDFILKPMTREAIRARLRAAERLMMLQRHLAMQAETDSLTGLLNRRAFFSRISELGERADNMPIVVCDIDHFKRINDTFGHDTGDRVLCTVAREVIKLGQLAVRLGGEEFAMGLPGQTVREAVRIAERLRLVCATSRFEARGEAFNVTTSFGVAIREGQENIELALKQADIALYRAKASGRNRVEIEPATLSSQAA